MAARGGRRKVAGSGELADLQMRSARPADPEFALMASEKVAAVGEAAERVLCRAMRRRRASSPAAGLAAAIGAAESCLQPFGRRVRANVKRLGRQG